MIKGLSIFSVGEGLNISGVPSLIVIGEGEEHLHMSEGQEQWRTNLLRSLLVTVVQKRTKQTAVGVVNDGDQEMLIEFKCIRKLFEKEDYLLINTQENSDNLGIVSQIQFLRMSRTIHVYCYKRKNRERDLFSHLPHTVHEL